MGSIHSLVPGKMYEEGFCILPGLEPGYIPSRPARYIHLVYNPGFVAICFLKTPMRTTPTGLGL